MKGRGKMSFIKETESYLKDVLKKSGYELDDIVLESSSRRDLGEFQINCAMNLAKKYGKNPREIANDIVNNWIQYHNWHNCLYSKEVI